LRLIGHSVFDGVVCGWFIGTHNGRWSQLPCFSRGYLYGETMQTNATTLHIVVLQ
jgi:hypothetical protein